MTLYCLYFSKVTLDEFASRIADAISDAQKEFKELHDINLSTSMGWISSDSADDFKLNNNATGLDIRRKLILLDMPESLRLIELADTDTQTHVKHFGKNGYLKFENCWGLKSSKEHICDPRNVPDWIKAIKWFNSTKERSPHFRIKFLPDKY